MQEVYDTVQLTQPEVSTATMPRHSYQSAEYRYQEVMGASPIRLVVMSYDVAIQACHQKDFSRATRAISVLRDALNFDYDHAAIAFFGLYQWCLDCIRNEDYQTAAETLTDLRDAWVSAEELVSVK